MRAFFETLFLFGVIIAWKVLVFYSPKLKLPFLGSIQCKLNNIAKASIKIHFISETTRFLLQLMTPFVDIGYLATFMP